MQHIRSFITAAVAGLAATGAPAQTTPLFDFATAAGMSETYAMLLAGVGALGLMASRCRNAG